MAQKQIDIFVEEWMPIQKKHNDDLSFCHCDICCGEHFFLKQTESNISIMKYLKRVWTYWSVVMSNV